MRPNSIIDKYVLLKFYNGFNLTTSAEEYMFRFYVITKNVKTLIFVSVQIRSFLFVEINLKHKEVKKSYPSFCKDS